MSDDGDDADGEEAVDGVLVGLAGARRASCAPCRRSPTGVNRLPRPVRPARTGARARSAIGVEQLLVADVLDLVALELAQRGADDGLLLGLR